MNTKPTNSNKYIPAFKYNWLTPLFDPFVRLTTREMTFKRRLIEQARIEENNRVLDLGCGTGTLTIMIKQTQPAAEVVGLDGDLKVLEIAKVKVARAGLDIKLDQGMAFEPPYPDASFDRVLSSLLFHHLTRENKRRTFREVFRVLGPGGELHLADISKPNNIYTYLASQIMQRLEEASDNVKGLLPTMLRDAGFLEVEETARYATLVGTISLFRALKPG